MKRATGLFRSYSTRNLTRINPLRAASLATVERLEERRLFASIVVNTAADITGTDPTVVSLRDAINAVNASTDPGNTITFQIGSGGTQTITLQSALPEVMKPVSIGGLSETAGATTPQIVLDGGGSATFAGLDLGAMASVSGMAFVGFAGSGGVGVKVESGASFSSLANDYFGVDPTNAAHGNETGIDVEADYVSVSGNVISANTHVGLVVHGNSAVITGNRIGTDLTGGVAMGNGNDGLLAQNVTGLQIGGPGQGNVISANTGIAVDLDNVTNTSIESNLIGLDQTGEVAIGNGAGIFIDGSSGITIGGSTFNGAGNVIAASAGNGVEIEQSDNITAAGNLIGFDASGGRSQDASGVSFGNLGDGVVVGAGVTNTTVGGDSADLGNVAGNSHGAGVHVTSSAGTNIVVENNYLGTDVTGTLPMSNLGGGALLYGTGTLFAFNLASGNQTNNGITLYGDDNIISQNWIGTQAGGANALGNGADGIWIVGSGNQIINNIIAYNGIPLDFGSGVGVAGGTGNLIRQNSMFANQTFGIDLEDDGYSTPTDPNSVLWGSNNDVMFPVIDGSSLTNDGTHVTLSGSLHSMPNSTFTIDFYSAATDHEGQTWLGSVDVMTDASGNVTFSATVSAPPADQMLLTATATTADTGGPSNTVGDTSEFSADVAIPAPVVPAQVGTNTSLASSDNPSTFGQSVTLTAVVTPAFGSNIPTGIVNFYEGTTLLGTGTVDTTGIATLTLSSLGVGSHTITASFVSDSTDFLNSDSAPLTQAVNQAASTATLSSSVNPSVFGQLVAFTATVTSSSGIPTGYVELFDGSTMIGGDTLLDSSGAASWSFSTLSVGDHSLLVKYLGDANFTASSGALTQTVAQANTATTITSLLAPTVYGQTVTFTAQVMVVGNGSGTPDGAVVFYDGNTPMGTGTLDGSGYASFTTSTLSPGNHSITAKYVGSTDYLPSVSAAVSQAIGLDASETVLNSSANPSTFRQSVTLTATVLNLSFSTSTPTGSVTFYDGSTVLGMATLDASGTAVLTLPGFAVGTHTLTAVYSGDSDTAGGTSSPLAQQVNRAPTHTKIDSSASPSVVGQAVTLTATVTSPVGTPGGSVVFYDGTTQLGTAPLDATGQATLTTKSLGAAHHSLTAYYIGDTNYAPANSPALDQLVNALASVSGHVYKDLTGDGMSADDAAMSGVAIQLFRDSNANGKFDANDSLVATTASNAAGAYSFTGLQPGEYFVQEATPSGYIRTLPTVSSYYVFNGDYNIAVSNDDFDNFAICTCKSDLKSYYFTDGCRRISDLRGNTHSGDTVSVTFTVKPGESDEFHLVVYCAPDATFNASDASQQQVIQSVGGTYSAGTYTLTVKLPKTGHYQIDFICGSVIQHFGPAGSNIFYTPQGRLISADNE